MQGTRNRSEPFTSQYVNEEVTLIKKYGSTADFEIKPSNGNEVVYSLEGLQELANDIPAYKIRIH